VIRRPPLFIGSSVEGLEVAYALQENLEFDCEPTVWPQGVFQPSSAALIDLYAWSRKVEFAVFVFTPDDVVRIRGRTLQTVRDNVVFELGLFIGALGPRRCFFVMPHGAELHLPSDLIGVEPLRYVADRRDQNLRAALGPACNRVRQALRLEPAAVPSAASEATAPSETPLQLAAQLIAAWDDEPVLGARRVLRDGVPFHIADDHDGEATAALSTVFNFLNSMADGVLTGRIDAAVARDAFQQPVIEIWTRAYGYFVPAGGDPEEAWSPAPSLAVLANQWASIRT